MEMKIIHDIHRAATSLLAEGAERTGTPSAELAELRDFVVAALRHHHESEDIMLWPMLQEADPGAAAALDELTGEHRQHLTHEESLTYPAMRSLTDAQWAQFSRAATESAPSAGAHLQIGLMEEVGDPGDVATVLAGLPAPAAQALPVLRERARATLGALRSGAGAAS
jgi:iron-sulfur cluster repair protein YtfE (RIC family)